MAGAQQVDHNAIKFGQVTIMGVVATAWVFDLPALVAGMGAVLLASVV